MIHIKKVMVPVDFSEASKKGVNYGLSLALEFEARLVLANIVPVRQPGVFNGESSFAGPDTSGVARTARLRADREKRRCTAGTAWHLLGTTAERVIRTATVPVLALPLPATYKDRWAAA